MSQTQPDWDQVAEKFDLWLPYIEPVGEALIERLHVRPHDRVLDVACGTGEPALTLARRYGDEVDIVAVDAAEGMVRTAKAKAERAGLHGMAFRTMPAEALDFADAAFDRVLCRFGVMLFTDPAQGLAEMWRVLKPGGRFALAVWGDADRMTSLRITAEALEPHLPEDMGVPLVKVTSMGPPGVLEAALETAGFAGFEVTRHELDYTFDGFDAYWRLVEDSAILAQQLDALEPARRARVRDEVASLAAAYHADGRLVLPHTYLVASGTK
jgi:SAM-dependent methyltransferase